MKIFIRLKPNSKHESIEKMGERELSVKVVEPPQDGKANRALIELLSDKFGVAKSQIKIVSGLKSRDKVVEID